MVLENLRASINHFLQEHGFVYASPAAPVRPAPIQIPETRPTLPWSDDYLRSLTPGQRGSLVLDHSNTIPRNNSGIFNAEGGRILRDYFSERERTQNIPEEEVRDRVQLLSNEVGQCMAQGFHRAALENINHIIALEPALSNPRMREAIRVEVREYIQRARIQREVLRGNIDEARSLASALHPSPETQSIRSQVELAFRQRSLGYLFSALSAYGVIEAQHRAIHGPSVEARHWQENFNRRLRTSMEAVLSNRMSLHSVLSQLQNQEPFLRTVMIEQGRLGSLVRAIETGSSRQYQLSEMTVAVLESLFHQQKFGAANELAQSLRGDFFATSRANEILSDIPAAAQEAGHYQSFFNVLNVVSFGLLPTAESNRAVVNSGAHMAAFVLSGGFANTVTGLAVRSAEVAGYSGLALQGLEFGVHTATMGATVPLLTPREERLTAHQYWNEFSGMWGLAAVLRGQGMLLGQLDTSLVQYLNTLDHITLADRALVLGLRSSPFRYATTIGGMTAYDAATNPELGNMPLGLQLLHSVTQDLQMRGGELLAERVRGTGRRSSALETSPNQENITSDTSASNFMEDAYYAVMGVVAGWVTGVGLGASFPRAFFNRNRTPKANNNPTGSASSARNPTSNDNPLEFLSSLFWRQAIRIASGYGVPIRGGNGTRILVFRSVDPRNISELPPEVQGNFDALFTAFASYRSGTHLNTRLNIILDIYTRSSAQVRQNIARRIDAMVRETATVGLSSIAYGLFRDLLNNVIVNYGTPLGSFDIRIDADPQYGITTPQFNIPGAYKHYTDRMGLQRILRNGKLVLNAPIPGRQQRVYVTDLDLQPEDVFRNIFLKNSLYRGRGNFVIGFDISSAIFLQSGGQQIGTVNGSPVFEMWANQNLEFGRDVTLRYAGENPILDDL